MDREPKRPIKKILVIVLAAVVVLGLAAYLFLGGGNGGPAPVAKAPSEGAGSVVTVLPETPPPAPGPPPPPADPCKENQEKLQGLFAYLDRQGYASRFKGGSEAYFKGLLARLLASPPMVQRETDNLMQVLQNRAHFFRVLGKKDTLLVREILRKEGEITEASLATLYKAMTLQGTCKGGEGTLKVSLKKAYPYAVFFLNTLGGSSYLMRRDSRVRTLTRYYAVLIVHQANGRKLNKLGFDIRPPLDLLLEDLQGVANLTHKAEYLETLQAIRAKY